MRVCVLARILGCSSSWSRDSGVFFACVCVCVCVHVSLSLFVFLCVRAHALVFGGHRKQFERIFLFRTFGKSPEFPMKNCLYSGVFEILA